MTWIFWLVLGLVALAGEALTTALVLACFAVAAFIVASISLEFGVIVQVAAFCVASLVLLAGARPLALRLLPSHAVGAELPRTGPVGQQGTVVERVDGSRGQIRVGKGEYWSARCMESGTSISPGRDVEIVGMDGLTALVQAKSVGSGGEEPDKGVPFGLSPREVEVLQLIALGLTNQEIADRLVVSPRTVHHHVSHIFDKMGVGGRMEAVRLGLETGLVRLDSG